MFDWIKPYAKQLKELWGNINTRAKVIVITISLCVIISLLYLIIWNGTPQYQTLFNNLAASDADAILQRLEEDGVEYRLSDNGQAILVSSNVLHKTRLQMAGEGLPSQGIVGFEIFDQSSFGTTDFERKVNFYRALGGELSRSIQVMDAVDYARVQITAPEESIFVEEDRSAQASVLLKIVPGNRLNEANVRAITNLVAGSVQGLEVGSVTIVDTAGNLLTSINEKDGLMNSQFSMQQFEIERQFSKGLKQDLRLLLTKVLGPNNYTLQVKTKMNFDQHEVESKEYSPIIGEEGIVRSQQEHLESYQNTSGNNEGVPGTTSNIPQYQQIDNEQSGDYENSEVITNYEINEKIERHIYAPGEVEQISVAVAINNSIEEDSIAQIENMVQAAIGYDSERGDIVSVNKLAFDRSLEEEIAQAEAAAIAANKSRMYLYGGLIAFVLIILLILFIIMKRSGESVNEELLPGKAIDFMVDENLEGELAATSSLTDEEKERKQLRDAISRTVSEQPEEVAQLLKSWLTDD